jgi:hypothetical protein
MHAATETGFIKKDEKTGEPIGTGDAATETGFIKKDEKGERIGTGEEGCKGPF